MQQPGLGTTGLELLPIYGGKGQAKNLHSMNGQQRDVEQQIEFPEVCIRKVMQVIAP